LYRRRILHNHGVFAAAVVTDPRLVNAIAERLPQDGDVVVRLQANLTQAKQNPVRRQLQPTAAAGV